MRTNLLQRCRPWLLVLGLAVLVLPAATLPTAAATPNLPALGGASALSLAQERRLGDEIARSLYRSPDFIDDPLLHDYLQSIWQPLMQAAQRRGEVSPELAERFAWELLFSRERSVNAFALPGGYLGLHLGLLAISTSADEIAAVLAHELAHVSQRHIARRIEHGQQQTPWVIGAMILGALAANAARNADIANAAMAGGQAVALQGQLAFSRDMEREADRVGLDIMAEAGFDGRGFVTLFSKLQAAARLNDGGSFPYLRTHPMTAERSADIEARLHDLGPARQAQSPVPAPVHALMAARARVLSETGSDRLQALAATLRASSAGRSASHLPTALENEELGRLYAATLAAARLREPALALHGLQRLQALAPTEPATQEKLRWLQLELLLLLPAQALPLAQQQQLGTLLQAALQSDRRAALLLGAQASLQHGTELQRLAIARLQARTSLHPNDALAWQTLAGLHLAQQQPVRAARAEAEARLALLDAPGALERLRAARRLGQAPGAADHIEQSIIDARLRHVEEVARLQALPWQ
ncbi:M48 family metalloprotease [Serpentinimonas maccroryi]|uniref:M48 family metalloprotease n=1 Tax=Serpentinimonas maccroryi TaxID=1458426 RepID=UPI0005EF40C1|nr:M48 family metalloprotease [Serpentinimonas maccroryi]